LPAVAAQLQLRPPRRYYEITAAGERMLADAAGRYRALDHAVRRSPRRLKPSRA
jgi:DNA-binding PadR family transcriptional regulator